MPARTLDLGELGLDGGGHLLLRRALRMTAVGERLAVRGLSAELLPHLRAFCRAEGHTLVDAGSTMEVIRGSAEIDRWQKAERAGGGSGTGPYAVVDRPPPGWGLAARGALVEAGSPAFSFPLADKDLVWSDEATRLYALAAASQWDPAAEIPWSDAGELPEEVEDAVVQVMTYLVENETAALVIPARFAAQVHPHFREVMQLLAVQAADEARHIEVFSRRAVLRRPAPGRSTAGGQASLRTLVEEPDFALSSFLLSVMGEGTFLSLLWFLHEHAPDPATREVARLAAQDEARHVAFGMGHLTRHIEREPGLRGALALAVERRHEALRGTAGLNEAVRDALVVLAAGGFAPGAIAAGYQAVMALERGMDEGRRRRLERLGFDEADARRLSSLHTRSFM